MHRYYQSGKFSDLTIKAAGREFRAHRLVICGQSEYFSRLFRANWKETVEDLIDFTKDYPRVVEALVRFMYGLDYDNCDNEELEDGSRGILPLILHVRVYAAAEKYGIPLLNKVATKKFLRTCTSVDKEDLHLIIPEVYTNTPSTDRGLRDLVTRASKAFMGSFSKMPDFVNALRQHEGFLVDILQCKLGYFQFKCPNEFCNFFWDGALENSLSSYYTCPCCRLSGPGEMWWKNSILIEYHGCDQVNAVTKASMLWRVFNLLLWCWCCEGSRAK
ncbi:hypothetical protein AJ79_04948 [Helicocarpus griseus UAMH5409]|uniref:BTB domain-containing protein n=1 Tax=Helicocarpus griseus UAMH5409 TaxID=1447875 RepID=A0A2B7XRS5_9EURO|nr:hypothetical protein AJ79_04948 [Helicocarpus griseus UAMH5409]